MKDEIKEILESLDKISKAEYYPEDLLTYKECHLLLDYITNLQEENDYLKDIVSNTELSNEIKKTDKWSKRELYKINYQRLLVNGRLQEENRQTKLLKDRYQLQNENYKLRIDKAFNRIQLLQMDGEVSIKDLGLIVRDLQGSDKNEK